MHVRIQIDSYHIYIYICAQLCTHIAVHALGPAPDLKKHIKTVGNMTYNNMICHFADFKDEKRQTDLGQSDLQASNFCGTCGFLLVECHAQVQSRREQTSGFAKR